MVIEPGVFPFFYIERFRLNVPQMDTVFQPRHQFIPRDSSEAGDEMLVAGTIIVVKMSCDQIRLHIVKRCQNSFGVVGMSTVKTKPERGCGLLIVYPPPKLPAPPCAAPSRASDRQTGLRSRKVTRHLRWVLNIVAKASW